MTGRDASFRDLSRPERATQALEELGRISLRHHTMESLLQTVADLAKTVMPGDVEASIFIQRDRRRFTVVSTGPLALALDEVQYSEHQGPCLHAAATRELTEIRDTRAELRWPHYAQRAAEHGNPSSLSVPLVLDDDVSGALNIYARQLDAFDADARAAATRFAPYASAAIDNMQAYESSRATAHNLEAALASRAVIDQAKGILMERGRLTADQAFQLLVQASSRTNRKLRDVAEELVHTGQLPEVRKR